MLSVEVDGVVIGVAVRGDHAREAFARALAPLRSAKVANHNYTVWLSGDRRVFHRLEWGGCTVVRTRDPDRFGLALAQHLSGHGAPPKGLLRTDSVLAVRDDEAILLPTLLRQSIPTFDSPLRKAGVILVDVPGVDVDPYTAEVVLTPPRLGADHFNEVISRLPPKARPDSTPAPGRYPIAAWYLHTGTGHDARMPVIDAVAIVLDGLRGGLIDVDAAKALVALFERTPFGGALFGSPRQLIDQLAT